MASVFTCTACSVSFSTSETHKAHYKLDWHRYNLRRKVAGLVPVDQVDFDRRLAAALGSDAPKGDYKGRCNECRKSFRSEGLHRQHLQSKKHKDAVKHLAVEEAAVARTAARPSSAAHAAGGGATAAAAGEAASDHAGATEVEVTAAAAAASKAAAAVPSKSGGVGQTRKDAMEGESEGEGGHEDEEEDEEELPPPRMGLCVCVFCNLESPGFEDNCAHMLRQHGFFIPDVEFLKDPEGLIGYLEEKVKLGNICLYCNGKGKTFHTYRALQQHMTDRSHCKLLYEEDEDMHEYEPFYDFSASYSDADKRGLAADGASPAGADAAGSDEEGDGEEVEVMRTLDVTDLGELVLLDGRTVGNRKWSRYYKQRLRTADEREVTVAHRKATRLLLGAIYDEEMRKGSSTGGAVALQRGERRAYGGLAGVSRPKDVKMLRAHQRSEARERLKTEIRQNKLNKTFDRIMDM